jgi:adenine-specific DNA-methyltransferase
MNVFSPSSFAGPAIDPVDPVDLADSVGSAYAEQVTADHRKDHGLYLTPPTVARFMGSLVGYP